MEEERQVPEVHMDYIFMGDEKEGKTLAFLVAREGCTQFGGSEEDDGRMDLPKIHGVASRGWAGVRGHHREVRQRTVDDEFDCVMEHDDGNDQRIKDDREQSSW